MAGASTNKFTYPKWSVLVPDCPITAWSLVSSDGSDNTFSELNVPTAAGANMEVIPTD